MGPHQHKLAAYASLLGVFACASGATVLVSKRKLSRRFERLPWNDLILMGIAAQKITRIIAQDRVTQPVRAPFTEPEDGHTKPKEPPLRGSDW